MRKARPYALSVMLISAVIILCYCLSDSSKNTVKLSAEVILPSKKERGEENRKEEVKERIEQEFLMTQDPALGYVPVERLILAEVQTRGMAANKSSRVQSGLSWAERGPDNVGGRCRTVLIDQNDATGNTLLVGSVGGGVWRTTNFKTATPTWAQIASISANLAITTLAQDPSNSNIMYAGTGEGFGNADAIQGLGIYKSTDGGLTWSLLSATTTGGTNQNDFNYVQKIVVYSNGDVYAAGISGAFCNAGGILKSTNGGTSWTRVVGNYTGGGTCANAFDFWGYDIEISTGGDIYAAVYDASAADTTIGKIYKSPAGATAGNVGTWTDISPAPAAGEYWQRIELACAPGNNNRVYALCQGTGNGVGGIFRSDNAGAAWTQIDNTTAWCDGGSASDADFSRGQAWYDLALAVQPNDDQTVLAGGVDIMRTTNAGTSWTQLTQWAGGCSSLPYVHADIHNIVYFPGSSSEFIVVCDGGVFYTSNSGSSFASKNTGLNCTQYYSCAVHPTSASNYLLGGAQDNGSHQFTAAGVNTVTEVTGGDGGFAFIDQDDPTYQITSYTEANYTISRNGGTSFTVPAFFSVGRFINPGDYDNTRNLLYVCGSNRQLVRIGNITSGSPTAAGFTIAPNNSYMVSAVKVDPNTSDRVWVAFSRASGASSVAPLLYYVDNANNNGTATATSVTLPAGISTNYYISSIDVENGDANHVLLTISNYGVPSVWQTTDGGANWTSLDQNGTNLPDMPVRWGIFIPAGSNPGLRAQAVGGILIATEMGIWSASTINGTGTVWSSNNTGMGNVRVDMLKFRTSDNLVAAATHGRGLFTTTLFTGTLPLTFNSFTGNTGTTYNQLSWETSNEQNNKGFEVERRYAGDAHYTRVGWVQGNNTSLSRYSFRDEWVDLGKENVSYRLKQVDQDGKFTYSTVVTLNRKVSGEWLQYVSVTGNNSLLVRINNGNSSETLAINIFDMNGRLYKKAQTPFQTQQVDIGALPAGTYVVQLTAPGNKRMIKKVVKP